MHVAISDGPPINNIRGEDFRQFCFALETGSDETGWTQERFEDLSSSTQDALRNKSVMAVFRDMCAGVVEAEYGGYAGSTGHLPFFDLDTQNQLCFFSRLMSEGMARYDLLR